MKIRQITTNNLNRKQIMKNKFTILFILLCFLVHIGVNCQTLTIHTIGDSTMEEKSEDLSSNPNGQRGWAQMLSQFVVNGAKVNNRSKSGTSSKTFYEEEDANGNKRFWATVKPQIKAGDYVLIQFGHNDEKDAGVEGVIGTNPWQSYTLYLKKYVTEVRELGAIPILLTPIVRNQFANGLITDKGAHNLGMGTDGKSLDYPGAMKQVALDLNCQIIDHTALTKAICEEYGPTKVTELIYNVGDGTHLGEYGATLYARLAVQALVAQNILTEYLNTNPDLMISPQAHDFGKCYPNTATTQSFSISGVDLTPTTGQISVKSPTGFSISTSLDGMFSQQLEIPYTNGNLSITKLFVKYAPTATGTSEGNIELQYGDNKKTINVKGECVSFSDGQKVSVYWDLSKDESFVSEGPITVIPETFSNMYVNRYATPGNPTTWENELVQNGTKTQRSVIQGDQWPAGEIDIVHDRYIQFGVTATEGTILNVDSIGLYVGGAGGSGMRYRILYSHDLGFSDPVMIADRQNNASNTMYQISSTKLIEVKAGESLYLRVYPWYNNGSSGKAICLYAVAIKGVVTLDSGLSIDTKKKNSLNNIYCTPNATTGVINLNYSLNSESPIKITINTMNGQNIKTINKENQGEGQHHEIIDLTNVPAGVYLCSVLSRSVKKTIKIIKE